MNLLRWLSPFWLFRSLRQVWRDDRKALLQLFVAGLIGAAVALYANHRIQGPLQKLTQEDIDKAVAHALGTIPLPSQAAKAAEITCERLHQ
jgi:hypothetical protein